MLNQIYLKTKFFSLNNDNIIKYNGNMGIFINLIFKTFI